jgi:hypothetical protein
MKTSSPENPKPPSPLKILLMGPPGSRKTTFVLQFPDVHVLDCDHNLDGPVRFLREGIKDPLGNVIIQPPKPDLSFTYDDCRKDDNDKSIDIAECFDRVLDLLARFSSKDEYKQRKIVFLDSLSHVNEFIIRKVLKMKGVTSMEGRHWSDFASGAYTLLVARIEQTLKTIICSVHEERVTESDDKNMMKKVLVEVNPWFSGRVGDNLGAFFTDVWKVEKRRVQKTSANASGTELWLLTDRTPKCEHLKNSLSMPAEIDITKGFTVIEPWIKGKI